MCGSGGGSENGKKWKGWEEEKELKIAGVKKTGLEEGGLGFWGKLEGGKAKRRIGERPEKVMNLGGS